MESDASFFEHSYVFKEGLSVLRTRPVKRGFEFDIWTLKIDHYGVL